MITTAIQIVRFFRWCSLSLLFAHPSREVYVSIVLTVTKKATKSVLECLLTWLQKITTADEDMDVQRSQQLNNICKRFFNKRENSSLRPSDMNFNFHVFVNLRWTWHSPLRQILISFLFLR